MQFTIYDSTDAVTIDYITDFSLSSHSADTPIVNYNLVGIITGNSVKRSATLRRLSKLLRRAPTALAKDSDFVWFQYAGTESGRTLIRSGRFTHQDGLDYSRSGSFVTLDLVCNNGFDVEDVTYDLGIANTDTLIGGSWIYPTRDNMDYVRIKNMDFYVSTGPMHYTKFYIGFRDYNLGTEYFRSHFGFDDMSPAVGTVESDAGAVGGSAVRTTVQDIYDYTGLYGACAVRELYMYDMFDSVERYKHQFGTYIPIIRYRLTSNTLIRLDIAYGDTQDSSNLASTGFLTESGDVYKYVILSPLTIPYHNRPDEVALNESFMFFCTYLSGDVSATEYLFMDTIIFMPVNAVTVSVREMVDSILRVEQLPHRTIWNNVGDAELDYRYLSNATGIGTPMLSADGGVIVICGMDDDGLSTTGNTVTVTGELTYGNSGF